MSSLLSTFDSKLYFHLVFSLGFHFMLYKYLPWCRCLLWTPASTPAPRGPGRISDSWTTGTRLVNGRQHCSCQEFIPLTSFFEEKKFISSRKDASAYFLIKNSTYFLLWCKNRPTFCTKGIFGVFYSLQKDSTELILWMNIQPIFYFHGKLNQLHIFHYTGRRRSDLLGPLEEVHVPVQPRHEGGHQGGRVPGAAVHHLPPS